MESTTLGTGTTQGDLVNRVSADAVLAIVSSAAALSILSVYGTHVRAEFFAPNSTLRMSGDAASAAAGFQKRLRQLQNLFEGSTP